MVEATVRQMEIVEFVRDQYAKTATGVNFEDIAKHFNVQKNAVTGYVNALEKKGLLKTEKLVSGRRRSGGIIPADAIPRTGNLTVNVSEDSRTGENFAVNIVGEFVVFMIFASGKMIESGLYPVASATKMADGFKINPELPTIDRIAAVAAKVAAKKVPAEMAVA